MAAITPLRLEPDSERSWASRLLWTLVGASLLSWAFEIETSAPYFWWAALAALVAGGWGMVTAIVSWLPVGPRLKPRWAAELFPWATAVMTVLAIGAWAAAYMHSAPSYGTDEVAFDQYAGLLVQHGLNPYTHSMLPSFPLFRVSPGGYTYTLHGVRIHQLSYPSLSFLIYVPFLALGWSHQLAPWLDTIGLAITIFLMFALLPKALRPAALLVGSTAVIVNLSAIGLTDMVYLPFLVIAAYRWDRFEWGRWPTYVGPVALGLAMAFKQTPWPILPFVVAALICEEHTRSSLAASVRRGGQYLALAVGAFLVPNLPYLVAAPHAWMEGTLTPLVNTLVPAGQGAVGFSLFLHLGGGSLSAYGLLSLVVLLLLLVAYVGTYPVLKGTAFMLPALAYFFAARSFAVYLVALLPPGMIAAVSVVPRAGAAPSLLARFVRWRVAAGLLTAGSVALLVYALAAQGPLKMKILSVTPAPGSGNAAEVSIRVTNDSGHRVTPAFTMETPNGVSSFWHVAGPGSLSAGQTATYMLSSPNTSSQPAITQGVTVVALLSNPASVSVSPPFSPPVWHAGFTPESFDQLIPVGRGVRISVELLDSLDGSIARAGVPITIKQKGARVASIDGRRPGAQAVVQTDRRGIASFTIVGVRESSRPVLLSANPPNLELGHVTSASGTLILRFRPR